MLGIVHWKYELKRKDEPTKFKGEIRNNTKIIRRTLGKHNTNCDSYGQFVLKNIFDVPKSKMFQYYSEMLIIIEPNELLKCYYSYDNSKQKLKLITTRVSTLNKVFPVYYTLQKEYYTLIKRNIDHKREMAEQLEQQRQQRLSSRNCKSSSDSLWKGMYLSTKGNDSNCVIYTSDYDMNNMKNSGIKRDSIVDMRNIINEIERNEHSKQTHVDMFNRRESKLKQYKNAYMRKVSKMFTVNKRNDELLRQYFLRNKQSAQIQYQNEHKQNNNKVKELCAINSLPYKDKNPKLIATTSQTISHCNKTKYKSVKTFLDIKKERNAYTLNKSNKQLITQYIFYKNNKCNNKTNNTKPSKRCYSSNEANALSNTKIPKLLPKYRQRHIQSSRDTLIPRYTLFTTTTPHKCKPTKQSTSHSKYNTLSTVSKGNSTIHLSPIQQHKVIPFKTVTKFNNIF